MGRKGLETYSSSGLQDAGSIGLWQPYSFISLYYALKALYPTTVMIESEFQHGASGRQAEFYSHYGMKNLMIRLTVVIKARKNKRFSLLYRF